MSSDAREAALDEVGSCFFLLGCYMYWGWVFDSVILWISFLWALRTPDPILSSVLPVPD